MFEGQRIGALLLMGGEGSRFGGETPKQFLFLGGKRVYLHTLEALEKGAFFDEILLVCHPAWMGTVQQEVPHWAVLPGGATRQESAYIGLQGFESFPDIVLIHDAVRPFVSAPILQTNIEQAILHGAVDTCIPSTDTLVHSPSGKTILEIPPRQEYWRGQTPQTFRFSLIWEAHQSARKEGFTSTDDCSLVLKQGHLVQIVLGSEENFKITSSSDLCLAEALHTSRL